MPAPRTPIGEFELIARYFQRDPRAAPRVELGIGDDCALLDGGPETQWAVTTDMLVEGVHFLAGVDPEALGHKALAVNLSDLAACGATPRCFFLSVALPTVDEPWLAAFSRGIFALADRFGCMLAGGDTTRSVQGVTISITALGDVPRGSALLRSGALAGDEIWVSGTLGDGALGLACRRGAVAADPAHAQAIARLERPEPRVGLGERLRGIASSAIDVSDGLAGDLGHILERSGVAAAVRWGAIPRSAALQRLPEDEQWLFCFSGGDDYELLFTGPPAR
ncbi:MAG TPA: thiamine-phosphate kinase, partial [Burkholderiaceae bacterium]|nr:thiamine-phosphate kinase [Burkholderiaceae bacterium]